MIEKSERNPTLKNRMVLLKEKKEKPKRNQISEDDFSKRKREIEVKSGDSRVRRTQLPIVTNLRILRKSNLNLKKPKP